MDQITPPPPATLQSSQTSLRLVTQFVQVGFPQDQNASNLFQLRVTTKQPKRPRDISDNIQLSAPNHQNHHHHNHHSNNDPYQRETFTPPPPLPDTGLQPQSIRSESHQSIHSLITNQDPLPIRIDTANTSTNVVQHHTASTPPNPIFVDPISLPLPESPPLSPVSNIMPGESLDVLVTEPPLLHAPLPPCDIPDDTTLGSVIRDRLDTIISARTSVRKLTGGSCQLLATAPASPNNQYIEKPPHPLECRYRASIIECFPLVDKNSKNIDHFQHLPLFVFPDHMQIKENHMASPKSTCHSFVLTKEDGTKLHCSALTFWERPAGVLATTLMFQCRSWYMRNISESDLEYLAHLKKQISTLQTQLTDANDLMDPIERTVVEDRLKLFTSLLNPYATKVNIKHLWVPRAMVIMSPWPIYDLMEDWLKATFHGLMDPNGSCISLEACLVNLVLEVPIPPPGRREMVIKAHSTDLFFSRPAPNEITAIKNVSLYPLFHALDIESIVFVLECLLNESRILVVSEFPNLLNTVIQSLILLLFPLNWFHVLISILPFDLIAYLEAPVPFLIGILAEHLPHVNPDILADDLVLVNLDLGTVSCTRTMPPIPLPPIRRSKLLARFKNSWALDTILSSNPSKGSKDSAPLATTEVFPLGKLAVRSGLSVLSVPLKDHPHLGYTGSHTDVFNSIIDPQFCKLHTEAQNQQGSFNRNNPSMITDTPTSPQSAPSFSTMHVSQSPSIHSSTSASTSIVSKFNFLRPKSAFVRGSGLEQSFSSTFTDMHSLKMSPSIVSAVVGLQSLNMTATPSVIVEGHILTSDGGGLKPRVQCIECKEDDTLAQPVYRCMTCGMYAHIECARQASVLWCPKVLDEPRVRRAALKLWISVLRGYRSHLISGSSGNASTPQIQTWINEVVDLDSREFMRMFVETQAFAMFMQDRTSTCTDVGGGLVDSAVPLYATGSVPLSMAADAEIIFFDEAIKAKRGRFQRMSRTGPQNGFLKDKSFAVTSLFKCLVPQKSDHVQVHKSFPLISQENIKSTPVRKCESLITPQEELMLSLYMAKMIRQAKRVTAAGGYESRTSSAIRVNGHGGSLSINTGSISPMEWWRRLGGGPTSISPVKQLPTPTNEPNDPNCSSGPLTADQTRAKVVEFLSAAWDTLKDPTLGQPIRSRNDYALRHAKLSDIGHGLNALLMTCDQTDLDDIIMITSKVDKMIESIDQEFREVFVDEGMLNRLSNVDDAPKLVCEIPSLDYSDFDMFRTHVPLTCTDKGVVNP